MPALARDDHLLGVPEGLAAAWVAVKAFSYSVRSVCNLCKADLSARRSAFGGKQSLSKDFGPLAMYMTWMEVCEREKSNGTRIGTLMKRRDLTMALTTML